MLRLAVLVGLAAFASACAPATLASGQASAAEGPAASYPVEETVAEEPRSAPDIGARGGMCGGIAGFQCKGANDYCAMAPKACVEIADASGACTEKPIICTMDYRPVCGCDGETYPNACAAAGAGVSIAAEGECPPSK